MPSTSSFSSYYSTNTCSKVINNFHCVLINSWTKSSATILVLPVLIILLLGLGSFVNSARIQTYTLYSELNGQGDRESFNSSIQDLYQISTLLKNGQVKWKCIEKGIWLEYSGFNYNFKNRNSFQYYNIQHGGHCYAPARSIQSIRHIGNVDLELPGLSLYKRENFTGEELYFDGTTLQLPVSISFRSFGFTGMEPWTLYSGTDFTGESNVCIKPLKVDELVHKKDIPDSQLIFHNHMTPQPITVGSIRRGCNGEDSGNSDHDNIRNPEPNKRNLPIPSLILYTQLEGRQNTLFMDGTELKLPGIGHRFVGYSIGGNSNWTIYSGNEFNEHEVCLVSLEKTTPEDVDVLSTSFNGLAPGGQVIAIHNTTVEGGKAFQVGSIRRGCATDGSATSLKHLFTSSSLGLLCTLTLIIGYVS